MSGCKTCGCPLSTQNKSGYCTRHVSAATAQDPAWREKQRRRARQALHENPERMERIRNQCREMSQLPQAVEGRSKHCTESRLWERGNARQPKGSPSRMKAGARGTATKLSWCPPHLIPDYKALIRSKCSAAEARAMIEEQHAMEMVRFRRSMGETCPVTDAALVSAFNEGIRVATGAADRQQPAAPADPLERALQAAGRAFNLAPDEIIAPDRGRHVMPARFAVAAAMKRCGLSLPVIARALKRQDHTTAIYWVQQAQKRVDGDPVFARHVDAITAAWANGPQERLAAA